MEPATILGVFSDCFIALEIPFLIYFLVNRNRYPIRDRMPYVVCAFGAAVWLWIFAFASYTIFCFAASWFLGIFSVILSIHIYAYRIVRLLFSFSIHEDIRRLQFAREAKERLPLESPRSSQALVPNTKNENEWKISWYTRYAEYMKLKFVIPFSAIVITLFLIIIGIFQQGDCIFHSKALLCFGVFSVMYLIIIFSAGWQLRRHHQDNFKIKLEFFYSSYITGLLIATYAIFRLLDLERTYLWVGLTVHGHFNFGLAIIYPCYLCWKEKRIIAHAVAKKTWKLSDVLQLTDGYSAFAAFLQTEFSGENLLFWSEVEFYRKLDADELHRKANQIYHRFLAPNAPFPINISDTLMKETFQDSGLDSIITELGDASSPSSATRTLTSESKLLSLFDPIQREIYSLMAADTFQRFERTRKFSQIREQLTQNFEIELDNQKSIKTIEMRQMKKSSILFRESKNNDSSNKEEEITAIQIQDEEMNVM